MSDLPDLTRLRMQVYTTDNGHQTLTVSFLVSKQQLLLEDFDDAATDAALKHAHANGHLPVGPMLVTTENAELEPQEPLVEGQPLVRSIDHLQIDNAIMQGDLAQVHCDVELGLSL